MYNSISFYCFIAFLNCNLKNVFSEETIPVRPNFTGKYTSGITNYEVVIPQRVNEDGSLISHVVSHRHSKRSTKELEFIFYKIPIGGKDYLIKLTPNRKLISPGAVIEIHKENVRKSANRKPLNGSSYNETIGEMFRNLDIRKLKNTDCYFSGTVKGENVSKAALSTCFGLAGFIQISKGFYTIEPVAEHDPLLEDAYPHILYKTDDLDNSSVCHTMGDLSASLVRKRRERSAGLSLPVYVETLIVMDKTLTSHHPESDSENYILTVFNMADNLFHDASLGLMMSLTVVRMIRMETENDEMNLRVNRNAEKTLKYFQNWQYEMNPGDDSHPNHHDVAVLVSKVNVCNSKSSCGLLGLTTIGKACDPKLSAALCEDNGLRLGHVIAHEIGHLLGADHDSDNSTSNGTDANGLKTVMHPDISTTAQTWSPSSQAYFKAFLGSGMGNCLLDEPEEHHFNIQDLMPGVMYNADFQCKNLITGRARECDMGSNCESLNCFVPGYACIITHTPPADGTFCGENMWCHNTKCLVVGERPGAIDGNWGEWSAWSDCSRTCGSGVASSERNCDKPQPSHGGKNCVGERKRYKICAAMDYNSPPKYFRFDKIHFRGSKTNSFVGKPCETGRPSFRDIQCGEFNDWIYPEDGKLHTWMAYFSHDDNPCILYCVNEEKQVAALKPRVVDGTMCYRGIRDICVGGICKSLPCDLHFESNAVEDACGICHGDGTGCEFSEGTETLSKLSKGLTKLVNIPSGTRNIKVEELSPTLAKIIVKDKDTREMYVSGTLGMFAVPGSQAWLGMIKKNQAALNIPGPVSKPLSIWIQRLDNVTVKWSMALPAEQQRKPEFAWDFLKWGPCSAKCGPGTQISKPSCMEGKAGMVEDTFCADLEMPPTKVRQCEVTRCEPRWMVGDWKGCEHSDSKKQERKRIVYCIKPVGEGEGESQIVPDSQCIGPKPHESEPCDVRMKRNSPENNDYPFVSDTSEYGFRYNYEDNQRRIEAPQKYSQTIPPSVIFSPHFKQYFHLLENFPSGTRYEAQAQYDVSQDFYKNFSKRQVGVTHIQPSSHKNIRSLRKGSKKSLDWEYRQMHRKPSDYPLAERHSNWLMQLRHNRTASVAGIRDVENVLILKQRYKKAYNSTPPNLTTTANPSESYKSLSHLIRKCRANEMSSHEMTELKRLWNMLNPKYSDREKRNMKHFLLFSKIRAEPEGSETFECNEIRKLINSHDKEIDESIAKLYQKVKNSFKGNQVQKESPLSKRVILSKEKRASLIWKKPKSRDGNVKLPKEQNGNGGGSESKNYLNNLFRDNHPKPPPSHKPPEIQTTLEKPVIKEGLLVIDKDPPENQEMEILFDGMETDGKRRKYVKFPQLTRYERKITIKGQDVFNLFQEIQDQGDNRENSAFYRLDHSPTEKLDINIKVPEPTSKPETTESTTSTTTTAATTKTTEKTSESTKENKDEEKSSTSKPEGTEETKKEEESTNKDGSKEVKTLSETLATEKAPEKTTKSGDDSDECDLDEEIPDDSESSDKDKKKEEKEEEKEEKKKKKKERKEKKKKEKQKKKEEKNKKKEDKEKKKKKKEKKKKKQEFEDSDLDWVDLVWTGFPRNQEEKLTGGGCDIDDEIEEFLKCTETTSVDIKDKRKEERERKKEERRRMKEVRRMKKMEEREERKKEKEMKRKMQTEDLLTRALNLEEYTWGDFSDLNEKNLTTPADSGEKEVDKNNQTKLFPESQRVMLPDYSNSDKEETNKYDQKKLLPEKQEKKLPDYFDSEKKDTFNQKKPLLDKQEKKLPDYFDSDQQENFKVDQNRVLHEKQGQKQPDNFDLTKEGIDKHNQMTRLPENQKEEGPENLNFKQDDPDKYNQMILIPKNKKEKGPENLNFRKDYPDKYNQMILIPEKQKEKGPENLNFRKDHPEKYKQMILIPEKQKEKRPENFNLRKDHPNRYSQMILIHENQGEKWPQHFDFRKYDPDKYNQMTLTPENQKKGPENLDLRNDPDKYSQMIMIPENQEEKWPEHFDFTKDDPDKYNQMILIPENQEEKWPENFNFKRDDADKYSRMILLPESMEGKLPDPFDFRNEDPDKYSQMLMLPENQGEKWPDRFDFKKDYADKYSQMILLPENMGEIWPDPFDFRKDDADKYSQMIMLPEKVGGKWPDRFDFKKDDADKYKQMILIPENQEEKWPENFNFKRDDTDKYSQMIMLPENIGGKWPDRFDFRKYDADKYSQMLMLPENMGGKLPDRFDFKKDDADKYSQMILLPENMGEIWPDPFDFRKDDADKYSQMIMLPEKIGGKLPDPFDFRKYDPDKYNQMILVPKKVGGKWLDHFDFRKDDTGKYSQMILIPEKMGGKWPAHSDTSNEEIHKYDQTKLFAETRAEKVMPNHPDSGKGEITKHGHRKLLDENQGEKLPDYFDLRNEGIFQYVQRKLIPEKQEEKLPVQSDSDKKEITKDHIHSSKEDIDKNSSRRLLPENQGEKQTDQADHLESDKKEIDKDDQRKVPENQGEKLSEHIHSSKEETDKDGQRKVGPENQEEKFPEHVHSNKEETDKDSQKKVVPENQEEKFPEHVHSSKEEIDKESQRKVVPENQGEKLPEHVHSNKEETDKDSQKKVVPENQEEKLPEHVHPSKEDIDKESQRKVVPENQGEKLPPKHVHSSKEETDKDGQGKQLHENQEEKLSEHIHSSKEETDKNGQRKQLHEKEGEKRPDHTDPGKEGLYKYIQRILFPENHGEKIPDHSDLGKEKLYIYDQGKLVSANLGEKLAIEAYGNDDISKYLRSFESKKRRNRLKEAKIIQKERKQEQRRRVKDAKKLTKKISSNIGDTRKMEWLKKNRLPKQGLQNFANLHPKWIYISGTVLPLNQEEKLTEQLNSEKEEEGIFDQMSLSKDKKAEVLGTNVRVNSEVSKRLRWEEKQNRKARMKQAKKIQKQREQEEKSKLEEGKRMKKLLIRKDKERKHEALHKKFKPPKKKHISVDNSNTKWADLVRTAFPINEEVRLTDHFDADREETEKYQQRKLLPKSPDENLSWGDIIHSVSNPKTENERREKEKAKAEEAKKEARKNKNERNNLENLLNRGKKNERKRKHEMVSKKFKGRKKRNPPNFDPDLAYLIRSGSHNNQEENFTGFGFGLDDETAKYLRRAENTKEKKNKKEDETNETLDEQIEKYLKLAQKIKTNNVNSSDLSTAVKLSTCIQCMEKTKKEMKAEEKEKKKKQKEEAKAKKNKEKQVKKEEKKIEEGIKKKTKKDKKIFEKELKKKQKEEAKAKKNKEIQVKKEEKKIEEEIKKDKKIFEKELKKKQKEEAKAKKNKEIQVKKEEKKTEEEIKKDKKIFEKELKKKQKEDAKAKKIVENEMKKEEKKIGELLKKQRKKEKKLEKEDEKMRKKKNLIQSSIVDCKILQQTDIQEGKLTADSKKEEKDPNKPETNLHDGL